MGPFLEHPSARALQALSLRPIDLTQPGVLHPKRVESFSFQGPFFRLAYATERVDEAVLNALWQLSYETKAIDQMRSMQRGEKVNRIEGFASENRPALHTAMRDPGKGESQEKARRELQKLKRFLEGAGRPFQEVVQIGIGGSDLGPRALYLALEPIAQRRAHFISNVDPDDANRILNAIDPAKTLVVVVSKSGTTLETKTNEAFLRRRFEERGLDPKLHFVAVTGEGSPMDDKSRYLESFYIWDSIGGRYSATSMVGGVTLSFTLGYDVFQEILSGAHTMDLHALEEKNLPLLSALLGIWNRNFLNIPSVAVIPYSQALVRFTAHLQQLDMESNGKRIDRLGKPCPFSTGPLIWGEPGTNGQHSFYQWIHQGTDPIALEMVGFHEPQDPHDLTVEGTTSQQKLIANLIAQAIALAVGQKQDNPNRIFPGNRPSSLLLGKRLDPKTLGALLAFYEHKVAFQGFMWGINSFDQEGVQLGKVLATRILDVMQGKGTFEIAERYLALFKGLV